MKKFSIYLSIYLLFLNSLSAQVPSELYSGSSKVFDQHPQFKSALKSSIPVIEMPSFDVERLMSQDEPIKPT